MVPQPEDQLVWVPGIVAPVADIAVEVTADCYLGSCTQVALNFVQDPNDLLVAADL